MRYKQFVSNRVEKINKKEGITWKYVPSRENPADIGSSGSSKLETNEIWMSGPSWLDNFDSWPEQIVAKPTDASESESRTVKTVMNATVQRKSDVIDDLIEKTALWKTVRILAWVRTFAVNCRRSKRISGPLTTAETENQLKVLIKRAQRDLSIQGTFSTFKSPEERRRHLCMFRGEFKDETIRYTCHQTISSL